MFAILISSENLEKIRQSGVLTEEELETYDLTTYLRHSKNWYLVRGYIPSIGSSLDWGILPQYVLDKKFEYNPDKIKTDWDQIVRK